MKKEDPKKNKPAAWITGHPDRVAYDLKPLITAQPLAELWDESGGKFLPLSFLKSSATKTTAQMPLFICFRKLANAARR